nr:helix-turn-helix domain-containing protein [Paraburkholderia sp. Tr-20389]
MAKTDFERLSEFRYRLRCFERFSEQAARNEGISALQYQLLLHLKGFPGRNWATVGELAERLQARHHATVALVSRCEALGLVRRQTNDEDRRKVEVHLLRTGNEVLSTLAQTHRAELRALERCYLALLPAISIPPQ